MSPLAIELFAGTGSGTAGWCELGGSAVCFDLEYLDHHGKPLARSHRVIQDVLTIGGEQFKRAEFLWGSSPCQAYSYLAMPWSRSKCPLCKGTKLVYEWQLVVGVMKGKSTELGRLVPCDCKENSAKAKELRRRWELDGPDNTLFDSVVRIQREASAAAGRFIPFIQENVRGAVPWIGKRDMSLSAWKSLTQAERVKAGRADAVFGSFYLWGCCAQIGKRVVAGRELVDIRAGRGRFGMGVAPERGELKGRGSTWFGIQNNGDTYDQREVNPVSGNKGTKPYPNRDWTAGTAISLGLENYNGVKTTGHVNKRDGHGHTRHLTNQAESDAVREAVKIGGDWFSDPNSTCWKHGSKSNARKAASALIAKIPRALSDYIAIQHYPDSAAQEAAKRGELSKTR